MVEICALASGSNGNCYYVGNEDEAVLIDVGISRRQVLKRMKEVKLNINKVKAIFISHEHADHIRGLRVLSDMNEIDAYLTKATFSKTRNDNQPKRIGIFKAGDIITVGNIKVHSFAKKHDAIDPTSFRVEIDGVNVGVLTDLGTADTIVKQQVKQCHALFLESNYDERLLEEGPYPIYLKNRVKSDRGHLSNDQAVKLVDSLKDTPLETILLSHISADNNQVEIAMKSFQMVSDRYKIYPTSRYAATPIYTFEKALNENEQASQLKMF
ncbi:MBL fold metallo-hydrolase [Carboxylicivirga sp. N1Y90]|uniref:MBL fold metallo-hydrolase n=1 Tax=Carboxylicivirga fragile TaxID=3417571 RepID=UPI003D334BEC|nr:MBL fold metallo-hydrolase [Marinilabiliaceae bacterium N1Y90]